MTDLEMRILEKSIWQASRGDKAQFISLLDDLFKRESELTVLVNVLMATVADHEKRIEALESRRGPGRPPKGS